MNQAPREPIIGSNCGILTDTIHERTTRRAEVVGHFLTRTYGLRLAPARQDVATADVFEVFVVDGKV